MTVSKANTLLVGGGGIGTMVAVNLVAGNQAEVTMVLRSNFDTVQKSGFNIKSVDHGHLHNWKPHAGLYPTRSPSQYTVVQHVELTLVLVLPKVPDVAAEGVRQYDYVVCATKNTPDISPTVVDILAPAITPGRTVVVLVQNGFGIEKPVIEAFPQTIVLSGVSLMGSHELSHGVIEHDDKDKLILGPFRNPNVAPEKEQEAGKDFAARYLAGGKTDLEYVADPGFSRWRKLMYNACLNPVCAILQLDTGRLRLAEAAYPLLQPAMREIIAAAKACGYEIPADLVDSMVEYDPIDMYFSPSMCVDVSKVCIHFFFFLFPFNTSQTAC